ncbi:MAG: twin-arginine translocation pathway signal protein [Desulfuromonadaceae bacterium]|nr:twin-arginine translocation pathway signal protein [Desulfuromonadaceae bacterium]
MKRLHIAVICAIAVFTMAFFGVNQAGAASKAELDQKVRQALDNLYAKSASAKAMKKEAKGILVFPDIVKGGFIVGGQYGQGALIKGGKIAGYYNTVSASYGLQAGLQKYGYALFLMTDSALAYLDKSGGWELGMTPNIVVVDVGAAGGISTTTAKSDVYAFFFDQKGLMAGIGLQGTKITKIEK